MHVEIIDDPYTAAAYGVGLGVGTMLGGLAAVGVLMLLVPIAVVTVP